jgi:hypothetical protein
VEEEHEPERKQVPGERLLDFQRSGGERILDSRERRQVGVDRERAERRERGEQRCEAGAEGARLGAVSRQPPGRG